MRLYLPQTSSDICSSVGWWEYGEAFYNMKWIMTNNEHKKHEKNAFEVKYTEQAKKYKTEWWKAL